MDSTGWKVDFWQHQLDIQAKAKGKEYFGIYVGCGGGKTLTAMSLLVQENCKVVLISCKPRTIAVDNVWEKAISQMPDSLRVNLVILDQNGKKKVTVLKQGMETVDDYDMTVFLVSHAAVWRSPISLAIRDIVWDAIVIDEAHKIKGSGSKVSKFFGWFANPNRARRRYALTGSPMHNSPLDVYGIYRFLNPNIFGTSYNRFLDSFATYWVNSHRVKIVTGYKNTDKITQVLSDTGYMAATADLVSLPREHHIVKSCVLPPSSQKIYDNLNKELIHIMDSGDAIVTHNVLTKMTALQQITSGHIRDEEGRMLELDCPKIDAMVDVLEDLPRWGEAKSPVVVFYRFIHDLHNIGIACNKAEYSYTTLDNLALWKRGHVDVICVQIDAGAEAIELTRASVVMYWSKVFSYGTYEQSMARVLRPDEADVVRPNTDRDVVTYFHLVVSNTIDDTIEASLHNKEDIIVTMSNQIKRKQ